MKKLMSFLSRLMISIHACKAFFLRDGITLTDAEAERVRAFLYLLAEARYDRIMEEKMCETLKPDSIPSPYQSGKP